MSGEEFASVSDREEEGILSELKKRGRSYKELSYMVSHRDVTGRYSQDQATTGED